MPDEKKNPEWEKLSAMAAAGRAAVLEAAKRMRDFMLWKNGEYEGYKFSAQQVETDIAELCKYAEERQGK